MQNGGYQEVWVGMESYYLMNIKFQLGMMKKFWTWIMVMISEKLKEETSKERMQRQNDDVDKSA